MMSGTSGPRIFVRKEITKNTMNTTPTRNRLLPPIPARAADVVVIRSSPIVVSTGRDFRIHHHRFARAKSRPSTRVLMKRSEEHTSELQSPCNLVCRLLLEKKKNEDCGSKNTRLIGSERSSARNDVSKSAE